MSFSDLRLGNVASYIGAERERARLWFFHHIPKTAGSSLAHELATYVKPYRNLGVDYSPETRATGDQLSDSVRHFTESVAEEGWGSASGHVLSHHVDQIAAAVPGVSFFTYLRHPVARVISEYRYCRTEAHPPWRNFIERYPRIEDFVASPEETNKMSRYLFGSTSITLREARQRLYERYAFVGLQERYPLSFRIMSRMMWGGSNPRVKSRVTDAGPDNSVEVTPDLHARILDANALDLAIYRAVAETYAQIASEAWAEPATAAATA